MFKLLRKLFKTTKFVASISASTMKRPELHIEQLIYAGKMEPGRVGWSAITFTASLDPFSYDNTVFKRLKISMTNAEHWLLYNAKVALIPGQNIMITSDDILNQRQLDFVVIFDRAERITCSEAKSTP